MTTALQHIQKASAHEDAAGRADQKYQQQMKAAGAELFTAFKLVMEEAGKPVPDGPAAFERFYAYARKEPWDEALRAQGKDREWAKRTLQWHIDPDAAMRRRAERSLADARRRKQLSDPKGKYQGPRGPRSTASDGAAAAVSETHVARATRGDEVREVERAATSKEIRGGAALENPLPVARGLIRNLADRVSKAPAYVLEEAVDTLRAVLADLDEAIKQEA